MAKKQSEPAEEVAAEDEMVKEPAVTSGQMVHHVIRTISRSPGGQGGAQALADVEAYLADYLNNEWRIFDTHYLGELPEGFIMLWVLTKET